MGADLANVIPAPGSSFSFRLTVGGNVWGVHRYNAVIPLSFDGALVDSVKLSDVYLNQNGSTVFRGEPSEQVIDYRWKGGLGVHGIVSGTLTNNSALSINASVTVKMRE